MTVIFDFIIYMHILNIIWNTNIFHNEIRVVILFQVL